MKTKHLFITAILACNAIPHQINAISKTAVAIAAPTLYAGSKLIQANGDIKKAQRLTRQDKDAACDCMIKIVEKNCDHAICKEMVSVLKKLKSTQSQQTYDALQDALQTIKNTEAGKKITKEIREYQEFGDKLNQSIIDQINEIKKSKKK